MARQARSPHRTVRRAKIAVGITSASVLLVTGLAWATVHHLTGGLTTSDALGDAPRSRDGSTNILLIGLDSRKDQDGNQLPDDVLNQLHAGDGNEGGYNTNTLILLHVPEDGGRVTAFSIPRDDYVAVRDIPGYDHAKIKEAYGLKKFYTEQDLARHGTTDRVALEHAGREAGRRETVQTVRDLVGVPIDRFAEISLAGFYDLANALDGVDVCLNHAVSDDYSGADFPAGKQTLNGAQALAFVRQRHGLDNGDLDRTHRQQAFLASVAQKLRGAGTFAYLGKLRALIDTAQRDVVVSAGWDLVAFAQQAQNLTGGNVRFSTLPIEGYQTVDGQDVNRINPAKIRAQVQAAFGVTPSSTPAPTSSTPHRAGSTLTVLNGTATAGLAARVAKTLTADGFLRGAVGNTGSSASEVAYGPGADQDARTAADLLGIPDVTADPTLSHGEVRVTLGEDYVLPATFDGTPAPTPTTTDTPEPAVAATSGPQGAPVDGTGIPCVD
jgi:LCP family protein required for cell wall assembly